MRPEEDATLEPRPLPGAESLDALVEQHSAGLWARDEDLFRRPWLQRLYRDTEGYDVRCGASIYGDFARRSWYLERNRGGERDRVVVPDRGVLLDCLIVTSLLEDPQAKNEDERIVDDCCVACARLEGRWFAVGAGEGRREELERMVRDLVE